MATVTETTTTVNEDAKKSTRAGRPRKQVLEGDRPFTSVPEGWTFKHEALSKGDFAKEDIYWQWEAFRAGKRVKKYEALQKEYEHNAEYFAEHGRLPASDTTTSKKITAAIQANPEMVEKAKAMGVDMDAFMKLLGDMSGE